MWKQSKSKFGNKKVTFGNETFDSKVEWQRWLFLQDCEKNCQIRNLRRQVKYTLIPAQYKPVEVKLKTKTKVVDKLVTREVTYTADFVYEKPTGEQIGVDIYKRVDGEMRVERTPQDIYVPVVEDVKGFPNDRYPIKKALMMQKYGIEIREVKKPTEPV